MSIYSENMSLWSGRVLKRVSHMFHKLFTTIIFLLSRCNPLCSHQKSGRSELVVSCLLFAILATTAFLSIIYSSTLVTPGGSFFIASQVLLLNYLLLTFPTQFVILSGVAFSVIFEVECF